MKNKEIDTSEIIKLIPHRHPFLFIDRVISIIEGKSCIGIKNLTFNENFFQGHFPGNPVMPGVLVIEAMAQTASVLISKSMSVSSQNLGVLFTGIENAKFKKVVYPGDTLELHIETIKNKMNIWFFKGKAKVNGDTVAEANFSAMLIRENEKINETKNHS